jgi:hypothetical protein
VPAQQGIYREYYAGIAGGSVANLTSAPVFPDSPTTEEIIRGVLESPVNVADNYGQRVRALLTPAVTGTYTFWIASDDGSELWLGTDASPATRRRIAYVNGWTNSREWTREANQRSALIDLSAGTAYYIEALQKEGGGGDNLAVAWQVPGTTPTNIIPADVIQPYLEPPVIKTQPVSFDIFEQYAGLQSVSFSVEAVRKGGVSYQWQKDGVDISGATQASYTCLADLANSNRLFRCGLSSLGGAVTSQTARYSFVPDHLPPSLLRWDLSHDRRSLTLTFSEPLLAASISPAAFSVSGTTVLAATLLDTTTNVTLRLADSLAPGCSYTLSLAVLDGATPPNALTLASYFFSPVALAAPPAALLRGGIEPPGPSSRRSPLAVTEINHTPALRADGRNIRFVELYNSNPYFQDVSGYRFSGAFDYTVPSGTVIPGNGYLAVAPAPADISAVYAIANVIGGFEAAAFDGTSEITLKDELGAWVTTVSYADDPPWPVAADGAGHSLVLARPSYGEREADGWAASASTGGSPGAAEPARSTLYEAVMVNEIQAHAGEIPGFVELHNVSTSAVSLAGCILKRDDPSSEGFVLSAGTILPAFGFLAFDETELGFKINGDGDTLWLFAPSGTGIGVIDAVRFGDQEVGVAYGRAPDGDAAWSRLETPTPAGFNAALRPAEIVINEIMYHPISEDNDDEYIELFNPGTNAVDLAGWKLGGGAAYTFVETIPARGYLIVPHSRTKLASLYPDRATGMTVGGYAGTLDNARDTVTLSKPVTVMDTADPLNPVPVQKNADVESVTYRDGGEWSKLADGGGSSLERIDPRADPRLARSWAASDETQKSAWTTLAFTGTIDNGFSSTNGDPNAVNIGLFDAGECLIDAVEVKAAGGANLVSNPSFEEGTNAWRFMGTHDRSGVETEISAPDGSSWLHLRATDRCHNGMNICRGLMSATLAKSGTGTIRVSARWLSGCPELLVRTRGSWLEACGDILTTRALGSPGQANSRACANAAPAIFDVIHQPVLPRNGEKVTVYARAQDPDGVSACTLYYRVEGQAGTHAVSMIPVAGGFFAGDIPASQPDNALVAFTVEAADSHALTGRARFPAAAPTRECLVRFNEPLDSRAFGIYRFWITKENIDYWASREKASNQPVDATFLYGTSRVIYSAGMQYSGSPFHSGYTTPINPGANIDYEANFQSDDTLLDDDGVVLSTIGNLGSDTNGIREQFCYSLVQAAKIPHMYRRYVHVYANGAEQNPKKIYEDTEKPNAGVLKHWFPEDSDNDFFKVDDWFEYNLGITAFDISTARLQKYLTPAPDGDGQILKLGRYRWNWLKRGYDTFRANDYTNFFTLVETLNLADTDTYTQRIQEEINLADFVPVIAVNEFIGNFDSYGFNRGKNMYLYDSADGWQLIAWDLDFNFGMNRPLTDPINPSLPTFPTEDPTMRTFLKTPIVARIFWRAIEKISAAANDPEILALTRAKYEALKADSAVLAGTFDGFMSLVDIRRTNVVAQLAAAQADRFSVISPASDVSAATNNIVTLSGLAPFGITAILVNGAEVPLTWTSASNWTAQVVLSGGTNAFQLTALAEDGRVYTNGTANLSIVYTGAELDPADGFLGLSEIMHTPATEGAAYVELANRSLSTTLNLSGFTLAGSVAFTFPAGTTLSPGGQAVVAADRAAFTGAYGAAAAAGVVGVYTGSLRAAGGQLLLKRPACGFEPDDVILDEVFYEGAYPWPTNTPAGVSLQLINPSVDNNRVANWAVETNVLPSTTVTPVPWNTTWKYVTAGYPGDTWAATNFTDSAWLSGAGPLGYETATLPVPLATPFSLTGRVAYYFRTTFTFAGNPATASLALSYMLDDAAAFYLNGQEIHRSSLMPLGLLTDASVATTAKTPEGQIEGPFAVSAAALRPGVNTLAVRVHQNQSGSSDLVFGMKLDLTAALSCAATPVAQNRVNTALTALTEVWLNELQALTVTGPADSEGEREPWAELYNAQTSAVSLAGWSLATGEADPGWPFPSNTVIAARGFLRVWLDGETGESAADSLHAGFRFGDPNGLLLLRAPVDGRDVVADYLRVTSAAADSVWGAYPDGSSNPRRWLNPATPGQPNRIDKPACRIVINELMAQNDLYTNPLSGKKDDWFELYNDGTDAVDLTGYAVTDTLVSADPPMPDLRATKSLIISNGVTLLPGQALRIWTGASKAATLPFDPVHLQAPFGLGKEGDQICLFNPALQLMDRLVYTGEQVGTASLGRWINGAEGELVTFGRPTPGEPNRNPRFAAPVLVQPPAFAFREQTLFAQTNVFATVRPEHFTFRLYPAEGVTVPANLAFDAEAGTLAWTPTEAQGPGLYPLRVCGFIADGLRVTACDEVLLSLSVLETINKPLLCAPPAVTVNEGDVATFTAAVTRVEEIPPVDAQTVLRITDPIPSNATFDAVSGVFQWATGESDGPSVSTFTVVAEDASDTNAWVSAVVTVRVNEVNAPLVYQSPDVFYLWRNEPFAFHLRYADPDLPANRLTHRLTFGPEGLSLHPDTGLLQWQPAAEQAGAFSARISTVDNAGCELSTTVTIWVDEAALQTAAFAPAEGSGSFALKWGSKPDAFYTVEWCPDLTLADWRALNPDAPVEGTGGPVTLTLSLALFGSPTNAFFRLRQTR